MLRWIPTVCLTLKSLLWIKRYCFICSTDDSDFLPNIFSLTFCTQGQPIHFCFSHISKNASASVLAFFLLYLGHCKNFPRLLPVCVPYSECCLRTPPLQGSLLDSIIKITLLWWLKISFTLTYFSLQTDRPISMDFFFYLLLAMSPILNVSYFLGKDVASLLSYPH